MEGGEHVGSQKRKRGKRSKDENADKRQRPTDGDGVVNPHQTGQSRRDSDTTEASIFSNSQTVRGQSTDSTIPSPRGPKYAQPAVSYTSPYFGTSCQNSGPVSSGPRHPLPNVETPWPGSRAAAATAAWRNRNTLLGNSDNDNLGRNSLWRRPAAAYQPQHLIQPSKVAPFRVEDIASLPANFSEDEKISLANTLKSLWETVDTSYEGSQSYLEARQKIHDLSLSIYRKKHPSLFDPDGTWPPVHVVALPQDSDQFNGGVDAHSFMVQYSARNSGNVSTGQPVPQPAGPPMPRMADGGFYLHIGPGQQLQLQPPQQMPQYFHQHDYGMQQLLPSAPQPLQPQPQSTLDPRPRPSVPAVPFFPHTRNHSIKPFHNLSLAGVETTPLLETMRSGESSRANFQRYIDRQQRIVDDLAAKFRNIVLLAASQGQGPAAGGDVTGMEAAGKVLSINVETQSLIHAAEEYLTFNRQLKELWLFGNVRELGEGEGDDVGNINTNAKEVEGMVEKLIQGRRGGNIQAPNRNGKELEATKVTASLGTAAEEKKDGDGDVEMS